MAKQYDARYSATQVGSYFVLQYYKVFLQQRDSLYRFYTDESCVIRVDGKISHSASNKAQIHDLIMSLNLVEIEIKTVNSLESLNGGVLVVVSGFAMPRDFSGQRKFLQTFFLAPQEEGYFVLNDMFHFADDEVVHQPSAPAMQEQNVDYQPTISSHLPADSLVPDSTDALEEVKDCVNSLHIEGEKLVEEFNYQKQLQPETEPETNPEPDTKAEPEPELKLHPEPELELQSEPELQPEPQSEHIQELEGDSLEEKTPLDEPTSLLKNNEISVLESHAEEPVKQSVKQTYASILMTKGKTPPPTSSQPSFTQNTPCVVDVNHVSHLLLQQVRPSLPNSRLIGVEEPLSSGEGESKSVFVKNLPSTVTSLDILCEFKNFGKIKHDAVFLRNRKDTGACYAFMEFVDVQSALNAIKASPIQLGGRRVYIEQKKSKVGSSRSRISGGRGSGGHGGRTSGRKNEQNCNGNGVRTNGFR